MTDHLERLDDQTVMVYLEVPVSKVVLLQAMFELYEGIATVRTLDLRRSLVCLLATPDTLDDCLAILDDIQPKIGWRFAARPSEEDREKYLGYFREKKHAESLSKE